LIQKRLFYRIDSFLYFYFSVGHMAYLSGDCRTLTRHCDCLRDQKWFAGVQRLEGWTYGQKVVRSTPGRVAIKWSLSKCVTVCRQANHLGNKSQINSASYLLGVSNLNTGLSGWG